MRSSADAWSRGSSSAAGAVDLVDAVARCRADGRFLAELSAILRRADAAVARDGPGCRACGACCRFEEFGHRLYVSAGELALLTAAAPPEPCRPGRCPYQLDSRCTARDRRSLGCRVFFCRAELADGSAALYEQLHRQIRRLHDRYALGYLYVELTAALVEICPAEP